MINGKDATLKEDGTYTIEAVSKDLTIEAVFAKDKTPEPEKPGKPKPEMPGDQNGTNHPSGSSKPGSSSAENAAAKTGDTSPVVPFICLLGLSAAAAGIAYYRKKQK